MQTQKLLRHLAPCKLALPLPPPLQCVGGFVALDRRRLLEQFADLRRFANDNNLAVFWSALSSLFSINAIGVFAGSALICPSDQNIFEWKMSLGAQQMKVDDRVPSFLASRSLQVNMQNIVRGAHSLFPPTSNVLHAYYELGWRDGFKFLLTNNLLEREVGDEV